MPPWPAHVPPCLRALQPASNLPPPSAPRSNASGSPESGAGVAALQLQQLLAKRTAEEQLIQAQQAKAAQQQALAAEQRARGDLANEVGGGGT